MVKYETMFLFSVKDGEEATASLVEKMKNLVSANGTLESVDEWGVRKLAYLINKQSEGYYVLFNFSANAEFPAELERLYNINENVLRSIVVRKPE